MSAGRPTDYTPELASSICAVTFIYCLRGPEDGSVRYVGKTDNPAARKYQHRSVQVGNSHRSNWIKALQTRGLQPEFVVCQIVPRTEWATAERAWIAHFKELGCSLVNHDEGGIGATSGGKQHALHSIKRRLIGIYNSFEDKNVASCQRIALKLRYLYWAIPDHCPKEWQRIGLHG